MPDRAGEVRPTRRKTIQGQILWAEGCHALKNFCGFWHI